MYLAAPGEGLAPRPGGHEAAPRRLEDLVEGGARDAPLGAAPPVVAHPPQLFGVSRRGVQIVSIC